MGAPGAVMKVYRDGNKAMIENTIPASGPGTTAMHTRSVYDLKAGTDYSWDLLNAASGCGKGNFKGDWGDPFASSAEMMGELTKANAKWSGTYTVNGMPSKVYDIPNADPQQAGKAWVETKYGTLVKLVMGGKVLIEIKQIDFAKPAASFFSMPPACTAVANEPPPPSDSAKIAAETGRNGDAFLDASKPPASSNSCTVLLKVVHVNTMAPLTAGIKVGLSLDQSDTSSIATKDVTPQYQNGVLKIENAPPHFRLDVQNANGGATAMIYRQCFQPQTVLYLLLSDPGQPLPGVSWIWSKTGK